MLTGAPINAAFTRNVQTVRENVLPGGEKYNIEVLVVADYSIYKRYVTQTCLCNMILKAVKMKF